MIDMSNFKSKIHKISFKELSIFLLLKRKDVPNYGRAKMLPLRNIFKLSTRYCDQKRTIAIEVENESESTSAD